jgi:hypothetical protein
MSRGESSTKQLDWNECIKLIDCNCLYAKVKSFFFAREGDKGKINTKITVGGKSGEQNPSPNWREVERWKIKHISLHFFTLFCVAIHGTTGRFSTVANRKIIPRHKSEWKIFVVNTMSGCGF